MVKPKVAKRLVDRRRTPLEVEIAVLKLLADLERIGPAVNWPHYGKLVSQGKNIDRRHCHLKKGRPTWVACWEVDSEKYNIEVYYVGTHEKAPY